MDGWEAGIEIESLSPDLLAAATAVNDESPENVLAHAFAYASAYLQHRDIAAGQLLEICLASSGFATQALREGLIADAAIFQAERRNRIDLAEQWLAEFPAKPEVPQRRTMIEAAILEARGNFVRALEKLEEIEKEIMASFDSAREFSLRSLAKWRSELERKIAGGDGEEVSYGRPGCLFVLGGTSPTLKTTVPWNQ